MQRFLRTESADLSSVLLGRAGLRIVHYCREPRTLEEIVKQTGLVVQEVRETLKMLIGHGIIQTLGPTERAMPQTREVTAEPQTSTVSDLANAKQSLISFLVDTLGNRAQPMVERIEAANSIGLLQETSDKLVLKLKLTVSQQVAQELKTRTTKLLKN